jgi:Putative transmembrane family 234
VSVSDFGDEVTDSGTGLARIRFGNGNERGSTSRQTTTTPEPLNNLSSSKVYILFCWCRCKMDVSQEPGIFRYVVGFLAVGFAWGFTTPFMRKAALQHPPNEKSTVAEDPNSSWARKKLVSIWSAVLDLVLRPAYTIPLLVNLSGSAMFFLIVGQAGMEHRCSGTRHSLNNSDLSLAVPITNSVAFLFTVLGEWLADGKSISSGTSFEK